MEAFSLDGFKTTVITDSIYYHKTSTKCWVDDAIVSTIKQVRCISDIAKIDIEKNDYGDYKEW